MAWNDDHQDKGDSPRKNPWGKPEDDRQNDHHDRPNWGRGPQDDGEINFDQMLKTIRKNLDGMLTHSGGSIGRIAALIIAVAAVLWLLSGIYLIQPNENGVVLTFGEYTRTDETPGIKWKVPWPIQSVRIVDVTTERRIHIGFVAPNANSTKLVSSSGGSHQESLMLTGDENIVDINFVVLWRVASAKDFLYSIREPEDTINLVAASTMREIIGQTNIQPALTDARTKIQSDAKTLMQKLLDEYHAGVTINNVQLQKVDPPAAVVDAFNEVQRARQKKEELKNLAESYRNDIIPRAKGDSEKMRQDADAYRQEVVNRATGDAKRFSDIYAAYKESKDVTAERMYLETMEQVLKNAKTVVMSSKDSGVLPFLPLNDSKTTGTVAASSSVNSN